jgi:nucleoside-diphosphate-sugar epimerase
MYSWKIGIVGGSGYIGSALAKHLSSSFLVKIIDVKEPKYLDNNMIFEQCDIRQYEDVRKALADVDLVIHTAIIQIPKINEQKDLVTRLIFWVHKMFAELLMKVPKLRA